MYKISGKAQMHAKAVRPSRLRKETSLGGGKSAASASGVVMMITAMWIDSHFFVIEVQ